MSNLPGGIWPAMFSPLTEDSRPNIRAIDKLVNVFVEQRLEGVYILGSTGQGPAMPMELRKQIAHHTIKAASGRLPVMVHVGAVATEDSVELAKHAADVGADAISAVPPIYYKVSADVELEHYRQIAAATELPFLPYYITGVFGPTAMPVAKYIDALAQIPNMAGMKLTTQDMYSFGLACNAAAGRMKLYSGIDQLVCHAMLSGAHGAIGTTYNLWGAHARKIQAACVAGQFERSRRFMLTFQRVIDDLISAGSISFFLRRALQLRHDLDIGAGRAPHSRFGKPIDDDQVRRICDEVDAAAQ